MRTDRLVLLCGVALLFLATSRLAATRHYYIAAEDVPWNYAPNGSEWHSQSEGECFKVIWRDPEHPNVPALPPRRREINAD